MRSEYAVLLAILTVTAMATPAVGFADQSRQEYHHNESTSKIDWYDYGDKPFQVANEQDKPVLLLVTAEWCHWCHVFWKESLQNDTVASYVNDNYVPVFLDYDVHRSVGNQYLAQGLPTMVVFAPDGEELKRTSGFIPPGEFKDGLEELATYVDDEYQSTDGPETTRQPDRAAPSIDDAGLESMVSDFDTLFRARFDAGYGGFGVRPPKPATPLLYHYRLQTLADRPDESTPAMTKKSLTYMAKGNSTRGLYDHVDGGFWHYTIQRDWREPHYEKITWKNAIMSVNYLRLAEVTGNETFRRIGRDSLAFLRSDLRHESGGFHGSMVAAPDYYLQPPAQQRETPKPAVSEQLYARSTAAGVYALLQAAELEGNESLVTDAEAGGEFLLERVDDQGARHVYDPATGEAAIEGTLQANAWTALALVELYEETGEEKYRDGALDVIEFTERRLGAPDGGYYTLNTTSEEYRSEDRFSAEKPAGLNGVMALALVEAYDATGEERHLRAARETIAVYEGQAFRFKQQQETAGSLALAAVRLQQLSPDDANASASVGSSGQETAGPNASAPADDAGATAPGSGAGSLEPLVRAGVLIAFGSIVVLLLYNRRRDRRQ